MAIFLNYCSLTLSFTISSFSQKARRKLTKARNREQDRVENKSSLLTFNLRREISPGSVSSTKERLRGTVLHLLFCCIFTPQSSSSLSFLPRRELSSSMLCFRAFEKELLSGFPVRVVGILGEEKLNLLKSYLKSEF